MTASLSARRAWIEIAKSTPEEAKRWSLSARRAWIEIQIYAYSMVKVLPSLSARRAWIEIGYFCRLGAYSASLSARRAWIEIAVIRRAVWAYYVALRKESVDRNLWWGVRKAVGSLVALRKESVDRNFPGTSTILSTTASLSARRAWIEIQKKFKESIDKYGRSPQGERG